MPPNAAPVHLRAPASLALPDLLDVLDRVATDQATRAATSYQDTEDLALLRWGVSLRHRAGTWSLRLPAVANIPDSPIEHHWESSSSTPPAEALALLSAFTRGRPVRRAARVITRRVTRHLLAADDALVAELHDDEVSVFHGRRLAERFRELVLAPGEDVDPTTFAAVRDRLVASGATPVGQPDRWARLFGPQALAAPDVPEHSLPADPTAGAVVGAAIAESTRRLVLSDPHARLGADDEGVHQARVATRRLRSDLRTFAPLLDPTWVADVRDELKWVAGALGAVRDADVLTGRLDRAVADLAASDQPRARPLRRRLARQRADARSRLHAALDDERYVRLLDRLALAAASTPLLPDRDGPADEVLPVLVQHPWKRLKTEVADLDDDPVDTALHQVRIRAKRLRYAAEAVAPQVGKKARRLAVAAARVQTVLGEHQDACVAEAWLRDAAAGLADPADAFVAGILAGRERAEADRYAANWKDVWAGLDRKKVRGWL